MIYAKHNFKQNFFSANGSDDIATKDILLTEVEKIIADRPQDLVDVMLSSGIKIKIKPSKMDLINAFFNNLDNSEFQKKLAELIIDNSQNPMYGDVNSHLNASADLGSMFGKAGSSAPTGTGTGGSTKLTGGTVSSVADAVSSLGNLFGSIKDGKNIKDQSKANMIANLQAQQLASQQPQGMNPTTKAMLIFGGVLLVGIIAIVIVKSRKS